MRRAEEHPSRRAFLGATATALATVVATYGAQSLQQLGTVEGGCDLLVQAHQRAQIRYQTEAERMFGYPREDLIGKHYSIRVDGPVSPTNHFIPTRHLIEPYARGLARTPEGGWRAYVQDGSYLKLREVTLSYHVGNMGLSMGDWTVSVVGRNLKTWTDYSGFDPEVGITGGEASSGVISAFDAYPRGYLGARVDLVALRRRSGSFSPVRPRRRLRPAGPREPLQTRFDPARALAARPAFEAGRV